MLKDEIKKPYFISLKRWLATEGLTGTGSKLRVFPPGMGIPAFEMRCALDPDSLIPYLAKEIYSWTQTPLGRVRVVIIGQDPYHS